MTRHRPAQLTLPLPLTGYPFAWQAENGERCYGELTRRGDVWQGVVRAVGARVLPVPVPEVWERGMEPEGVEVGE